MDSYVVFDLETTGFSQHTDEIIDIGAWKFKDGVKVDEFSTLIKPQRGIPYRIQTLTHITNDMVADAPSIAEVISDFVDFCRGNYLLGHNLGFDYRFMKENCTRFSLDFTDEGLRAGIDTMGLARKFYNFDNNRLETLISKFNLEGVCQSKDLHRAKVDAYMTHLVYQKMLSEYGNIIEFNTPYLLEDKRRLVTDVKDCDSFSFN